MVDLFRRFACGWAGLAAFLVVAGCNGGDNTYSGVQNGGPFDVWISGGLVIDGTGAEARLADVLIRAGSIAFVGQLRDGDVVATDTIDATGKVVTPGFIDTHAHGSPERTPEFTNFLAMGVTTIGLGQDGGGETREDIQAWVDSINANGLGTNVAYFAGHGSLRLRSEVGYSDNPSADQIENLASLLRNQLELGFFGMSTGLEYTPGIYAADEELLALAQIVGASGGIVMSHMRDEDDDKVESSIRELLRQGEFAPVHVSHMKSVYGKGADRAEELLALLDSARAAGVSVTADMYPYSASYTGIGIVFPTWAKAPNNYEAVRKSRRDELADYVRNRVNLRNGPSATLLGTGEYEGKTLEELATERGLPFEDILIDEIGPGGASGAYFVMNDDLQERIAQDPHVMFCSDGSPTGFHPRGHGTFAKVIETYVLEKELFRLEEAIRKMTSLPAQTLGLTKRGEISPGFIADLVVFDPANVRATATYSQPHRLAEGFDTVLIGGATAFSEGMPSNTLRGKILLKR